MSLTDLFSPQSPPTLLASLGQTFSDRLSPDRGAFDVWTPPIDTADWRQWVRDIFPAYVSDVQGNPIDFAPHHAQLWDWIWSLRPNERPRPLVEILARGGAKSTTVELATVAIGARRVRRYGLYVCDTQDQADDHVGNIAGMLESREISLRYPDLADRAMGKFGNSKGWRRNRLRTAAGFTIDALGLDVAARGIKLDEMRPDLLILDDVDDTDDGPERVQRNVNAISRKLIPAGSRDLAVLAVQNLLHPDGVFAQLADGRADFLGDRVVVGPVPALHGDQWLNIDGREQLVGGTPTWEGQSLAVCQGMVENMGRTAFEIECQHRVDVVKDGMFSRIQFRRCLPADVPELIATVVWVDVAVTNKDSSDSQAIICDGLAASGDIYRREAWEGIDSPLSCLVRAILMAIKYGALSVGVETDQGGDTWQSVYREAVRMLKETGLISAGARLPVFREEKAGRTQESKAYRAQHMLPDYERGRIVHVVGGTEALERSLRRFPKRKPYDLVDASYWSWRDLRENYRPPTNRHASRPLVIGGTGRTSAVGPDGRMRR